MSLLRQSVFLLLLFTQPVWAEVFIVASETSPVHERLAAALKVHTPTEVTVSLFTGGIPGKEDDHYFLVGEDVIRAWPEGTAAVAVLTSRSAIEANRSHLVGAVYLEPPLARQYSLVRYMFGDARTSLIYTQDVLPWAWPELSALEEQGVRLVRYQPGQSLNYALKDALRGSDVLLGISDSGVYNPQSIKNILISAYRQNIPLVGPARAYIRAGAIASTYSSLDDIARRMADMLKPGQFQEFSYNPYFSVAFNEQVARSLNVMLPETEMEVVSELKK